jgi:F-type H+-transporting ATPase subunit b
MEGLGFDWKILLGQIVNFVILFFLLKKFAFKPFFEVLRKRKKTIEDGLKRAEEAEESLKEADVLKNEIKKSGEGIIKEALRDAEKKAKTRLDEAVVLAEEEKNRIIENARQIARQETEATKDKRRREVLEQTFLLAEKFLKEKIDKQKDEKLLEEMILKIK